MRMLRFCAYTIGALAAGLGYAWGIPFLSSSVSPLVSIGVLGALTAILVLLAAGRAPALLLVPLVCLPIAAALATQITGAEARISGRFVLLDSGMPWWPPFVLPETILALVATALALPYCVRLVRRAL